MDTAERDVDATDNALELRLKPPIPEPLVRPNVFEWIQSRLAGARGTYYLTLADIYYAGSCLPEADKRLDRRWDTLIPRTLMFKQFFKLIRAESTAVQMVEAIKDCGMKKHVLETLPEAILVPLQDAISLCQPHPPSQWSKDLLELVKRSDISYILESAKQPNRSMSSLLVGNPAIWPQHLLIASSRLQPIMQHGISSCSVRALKRPITLAMTKATALSDKPSFAPCSRTTVA